MLTNPQPPRIHLPKGWQDGVKSASMEANFRSTRTVTQGVNRCTIAEWIHTRQQCHVRPEGLPRRESPDKSDDTAKQRG